MADIAGSRVLVMGGSGVLGRLLARGLVDRGASVVLAGRDADRLREAAAELGGISSVICDLRYPEHIDHAVGFAAGELGGLDGVVNAAGVVAFGPFVELSDETLAEVVAADLTGPLRLMRRAAAEMDGGFIVNITGVVAEQPVAGMAAYVAAKAGLSAATRAVARELRRQKIHVLDARPGHTETGLAGRAIAGDAPAFGEGLEPTDVAQTILDGIEAGTRELGSDAFA
jgi:cyclic-di-GMP-binding biofilm dispersal mediator protein